MANDIASLVAALKPFREKALDGAATGLDTACGPIADTLHHTSAHGDQSGATRAAYGVWRVGRGENGAGALAASVSAGEGHNPGATATSGVTIAGELGVIISDPMEYAPERETANAGDKATIGPAIGPAGPALTAAAAQGSKKALGG